MTKSHTQKTAKYRPLMTESQIVHIIGLCKKDLSSASISVLSILAPFEYKIRNQAIEAAYIPIQPKPDLGDSFLENDSPKQDNSIQAKFLLEQFKNSEEEMTVRDLETIEEYRFLNNLMSESERIAYENKLLGL